MDAVENQDAGRYQADPCRHHRGIEEEDRRRQEREEKEAAEEAVRDEAKRKDWAAWEAAMEASSPATRTGSRSCQAADQNCHARD